MTDGGKVGEPCYSSPLWSVSLKQTKSKDTKNKTKCMGFIERYKSAMSGQIHKITNECSMIIWTRTSDQVDLSDSIGKTT